MSEKDIIILYIKEFSMETKDYPQFENYVKKANEDKDTKIIIVPTEVVEKVERL